MWHPSNGTYDTQMTADMQRTTSAVVGWLLMASYCYYVENDNLLSDHQYDKAARWLQRHYREVRHKYKHLIPYDPGSTTSMFDMPAERYPHRIIELAQQARRALEKQG